MSAPAGKILTNVAVCGGIKHLARISGKKDDGLVEAGGGGRKWQSDTSLRFSCLLIKTERRRASEREASVVVQRDR